MTILKMCDGTVLAASSIEENRLNRQAGFGVVQLLFWLFLIAAGVVAGYKLIPVHYMAWKVDDAFKTIVQTKASADESFLRANLPDILHAKYISRSDLPKEFYDHLVIKADGNRVSISSKYHVVVWLLPEDPGSMPKVMQERWQSIRAKSRFDFNFNPHAETP